MQVCSLCKQLGHNKNNSLCITNIINKNINKMSSFTQSFHYYALSIQYLLNKYKNKFCYISSEQVKFLNGVLYGFNELISIHVCNLPLVYVKLNITQGKDSHANYLLFDTKNKILKRYEPHGIAFPNDKLDQELSLYSKLYNYSYINPFFTCPYVGIQTVAEDKVGMCQTVVLYSLIGVLDPKANIWKPKVLLTKSDTELAKKEINRTASQFLTHIYYILPESLRPGFLMFNNTSEFIKSSIYNFLENKILV